MAITTMTKHQLIINHNQPPPFIGVYHYKPCLTSAAHNMLPWVPGLSSTALRQLQGFDLGLQGGCGYHYMVSND